MVAPLYLPHIIAMPSEVLLEPVRWIAPSFVGTLGLDFLLLLKLDGRQHSVSHVFAFRVVEHFDVVEHVLACFIAYGEPCDVSVLALED